MPKESYSVAELRAELSNLLGFVHHTDAVVDVTYYCLPRACVVSYKTGQLLKRLAQPLDPLTARMLIEYLEAELKRPTKRPLRESLYEFFRL